jgi:hypothetical protein
MYFAIITKQDIHKYIVTISTKCITIIAYMSTNDCAHQKQHGQKQKKKQFTRQPKWDY